MKILTKILIIFLSINLCLLSNEMHNKSKKQIKQKVFSNQNQIAKNKIIKKRIQQRLLKTQERDECEEGYIDDNYISTNSDGYKFSKVRIRSIRIPAIGDKFSIRFPPNKVFSSFFIIKPIINIINYYRAIS